MKLSFPDIDNYRIPYVQWLDDIIQWSEKDLIEMVRQA